MTQQNNIVDAEIYRWFDVFRGADDSLVEIRVIGRVTGSGYFTDPADIVRAVSQYAADCNVYWTINTLDDAVYSREQRDCILTRTKAATTDKEVMRRKWVLVDIDSDRLAGICATDEEAGKSMAMGNAVYSYLKQRGFNAPVCVYSGNGVHLYYRVDMECSEATDDIIKRFLVSLSLLFSNDDCKIDTSVFNRARISRLPGTWNRKGSSKSKDRPQRLCRIAKVPDTVKVTPTEYFKAVADMVPKDEKPSQQNDWGRARVDVPAFLERHDIRAKEVRTDDGTKYLLDHCVFDENHTGGSAMIYQSKGGAVIYKCLHNSCQDRTWRDVMRVLEPDSEERAYERSYGKHRRYEPQEPVKQEYEKTKGNIWQSLSEIEDEDRSTIVSIPSGITMYDRECCGFDKPSVNIWSGQNGAGKTSLLNLLTLNAIESGFKVAVYSGEMRGRRMKKWFIQQAAGKANTLKSRYNEYDYYVPEDVRKRIVTWLDGSLFNYNTAYSSELEKVCMELEEIIKARHVDMVVVDNLSCLDLDSYHEDSVNEQQKKAIKALVRLAGQYEVALHLVCHPNKSLGFLRKESISGTKVITDLADNVFILHRWNLDTMSAAEQFLGKITTTRISDTQCTNVIEVVKHREFGEAEGHFYYLYFEPESRRLKNDIAENVHYGWEYGESRPMPQLAFDSSDDIDDLPN